MSCDGMVGMRGTLQGDKFIVIFEHDCANVELQAEIHADYLFWRESCGYVQIWLINGIVYDILKRDESRFMYE